MVVPEALERGLEERVLALWGHVLGVEACLLDRDGLVVVEDHRDIAARRRATIRTARGTMVLCAPDEEPLAGSDPAAYAAGRLRPRGRRRPPPLPRGADCR